jgi:hypothetical protein
MKNSSRRDESHTRLSRLPHLFRFFTQFEKVLWRRLYW